MPSALLDDCLSLRISFVSRVRKTARRIRFRVGDRYRTSSGRGEKELGRRPTSCCVTIILTVSLSSGFRTGFFFFFSTMGFIRFKTNNYRRDAGAKRSAAPWRSTENAATTQLLFVRAERREKKRPTIALSVSVYA